MVDVIYEFKKFSEFVAFKLMNFTHISIADQIVVSCIGLGLLLLLISIVLFMF